MRMVRVRKRTYHWPKDGHGLPPVSFPNGLCNDALPLCSGRKAGTGNVVYSKGSFSVLARRALIGNGLCCEAKNGLGLNGRYGLPAPPKKGCARVGLRPLWSSDLLFQAALIEFSLPLAKEYGMMKVVACQGLFPDVGGAS